MTFEEALEEIKAEDEECRKVIQEAERNAEEYLRKSEDESSTERPYDAIWDMYYDEFDDA